MYPFVGEYYFGDLQVAGKSTAAEALAAEMGVPLVVVRLDSVISSYLGETSSNLRRIMDYSNQGRWVVLFDEFDAIGRLRDDPTEHGEDPASGSSMRFCKCLINIKDRALSLLQLTMRVC